MRYWDSSALLPLLVQEVASSKRQQQLLEDPVVVTWWGSKVECASALNRLHRERNLDPDAVEAALQKLNALSEEWAEIQATSVVQARAMRVLRVHSLRATDALHLAAALVSVNDAPQRLAWVCADARLAEAARKEGFQVLV